MITIPTISQLYTRVSDNLKSSLGLSNAIFKSVLNAFSNNQAGVLKLLYLYISDVQKNLFIDTAYSESIGGTIERFGRLYLNRDPNPATQGEFVLLLSGVPGTVIPSGTAFKSNENSKNPNKLYLTQDEFTFIASNLRVNIFSNGGGSEYDLDVNDELVVTQPIIGLNDVGYVVSTVTQPLDAESLEDYRNKILIAIQLEPQGGSKSDYRIWSEDAGGVRNVYPYVKDSEAGTVQVFVEANASDSTDGYGTPTTAILENVEEVINFDPDETKETYERARLPIQVNLEVLPIVIVPIDVTITGLQDTSISVKDSIRANMEAYLLTVRPFISGSDLQRNKNDILYISGLQSAVTSVLVDSNFFSNFQMYVGGVNKITHLFVKEKIPYLRYVIYV